MKKMFMVEEKPLWFGFGRFTLPKTFSRSHWDRYLGMTAAMTQVPVFYLCTQESELVQV